MLKSLYTNGRKIITFGLGWDAVVAVATTVFIGPVAAHATCTSDSPARYAIVALSVF